MAVRRVQIGIIVLRKILHRLPGKQLRVLRCRRAGNAMVSESEQANMSGEELG